METLQVVRNGSQDLFNGFRCRRVGYLLEVVPEVDAPGRPLVRKERGAIKVKIVYEVAVSERLQGE
jgi:hypothetical protein